MVRKTGKSDSGIESHWSFRFQPRKTVADMDCQDKTELLYTVLPDDLQNSEQPPTVRYGTVRLCLPITVSTQYVPLVPSGDPNMDHRAPHQDAWPLRARMGWMTRVKTVTNKAGKVRRTRKFGGRSDPPPETPNQGPTSKIQSFGNSCCLALVRPFPNW